LKYLSFFPTPYPDEILYSVLSRYHFRCGNPSARQTNISLWGNIYGKRLYLPDGIENIAARIPRSTNLTTERFIKENTIFPVLKPFLTQEKRDELLNAMMFGNPNIYNLISFFKVFTMRHRRLRCCAQCARNDTEIYGEPYWHNIHQLPGIYVCPIHDAPTIDSDIELDELRWDYYPLLPTQGDPMPQYERDIAEKLLNFAQDAAWLLQHGYDLQGFEHTNELYDNRLRVKGYRDPGGKTSGKRLARDIVGYYGREFLDLFDAYNSGACTWIKRIVRHRQSFRHPLYHLLLIRFLADSAADFFTGVQEKRPEYLPFGAPPYPCRNRLCEYHLQDVIERIEIKKVHATPYAAFVCPHCGFTYNRKGNVPKERQYAGQIHIAAYGQKWEKTVSELLVAGESPYKIAREVHCDVRTILSFGVDSGLLPPERHMGRKPYVPVNSPQGISDSEIQRELYRQRWLDAIAENPGIARNELRQLDSKADQWLHLHDSDWLEQNSPPSKHGLPSWAGCDDEYLERVENAVGQIRASPGIPRRISIPSIGKKAGIIKPHTRLASDLLPKTKAFVAANAETPEQWRKRKILWAVQQMRERGELMTVYKVRHAANIEDKERKLDGFILECINDSE
jgi:hypothetical protein